MISTSARWRGVMPVALLSAAILVSGVVYIWAACRGRRSLVYLLKPGTMLLILALAVSWAPTAGTGPAAAYAGRVAAALAFSLAGDVFLMLSRRWFAWGLAAFLAAHLAYLGAFAAAAPPAWPAAITAADAAAGAALALAAAAMCRRLLPGLRSWQQPALPGMVALYTLVITAMVWRALGTLWALGPLPFRPALAAAGALLFYASDAALAWDRFVRPLPARHWIVMGTYFAAQYCFALSVAWPPAGAR